MGQEQIFSGLSQCTKSLCSMGRVITDTLMFLIQYKCKGRLHFTKKRCKEARELRTWGISWEEGQANRKTCKAEKSTKECRIVWIPFCSITFFFWLEMVSGKEKVAFRMCFWVEKGQVFTIAG